MLHLLLFLLAQHEPPQFNEQVIDADVKIGYGIALGDVDGDGKDDILLADKEQIRWYRNGDWKKFVMAENLTQFDNVCIAARDLDDDGKVEVAVGGRWNPSETSDTTQSGAVHYLVRPADPHEKWEAVELHHEPTIHRMRWALGTNGKYYLVVLPLHGRDNKGGEGKGVTMLAYEYPQDVHGNWNLTVLADDMHMTHNLAVEGNAGGAEKIYVAGKEGVRIIRDGFAKGKKSHSEKLPGKMHGAGEIRLGKNFIATIEPMHGNNVVIYPKQKNQTRIVLDSTLKEGHALGIADFLGNGQQQIVAGWRNPDKDGNFGIKLYSKNNGGWSTEWIDKNGMACEDLQVADLNGDGKTDIIAAGRSTHNLKIYWNNN